MSLMSFLYVPIWLIQYFGTKETSSWHYRFEANHLNAILLTFDNIWWGITITLDIKPSISKVYKHTCNAILTVVLVSLFVTDGLFPRNPWGTPRVNELCSPSVAFWYSQEKDDAGVGHGVWQTKDAAAHDSIAQIEDRHPNGGFTLKLENMQDLHINF